MGVAAWTWALALALGLAGQVAMADSEVHAIGIHQAEIHRGDKITGPQVAVRVDRPGAEVVLVLKSCAAVRSVVTLSPGTRLERIVPAGSRATRSEVVVDGKLRQDVQYAGLPVTWQTEGQAFRALVSAVPQLLQVKGLNTFQGSYTAPQEGFAITASADDNPALKPDYLVDRLADPSSLPAAFAALIDGKAHKVEEIALDDKGFRVTSVAGEVTTYPISLDVPQVGWPVGAARDPVTGILYGVTLEGEGFLYAYDPATKAWSVASSINQADASGMIFDPQGKRVVIVVSGMIAPSGPALRFHGRDGTRAKTPLALAGFPGLGDVGDENGPGIALVPVAVAGDQVLLKAQGGLQMGRKIPGQPDMPMRLYAVDMTTGQAVLAAFSDPGNGKSDPWQAAPGREAACGDAALALSARSCDSIPFRLSCPKTT